MADVTPPELGAVFIKVNADGDYELRATPLDLNYPVAGDVRAGTGYSHSENPLTGTLVIGGGGDPPATPTLTVSDNGLGTGATATIIGSDAGSSNTIYVAALGSTTWSSAGARAGDGTISITLVPSNYWAYVRSILGGTSFSLVVYFTVISLTSKIAYYRVTSISREPGAINMAVSVEKTTQPIKPI
jgi:hypothetical protein